MLLGIFLILVGFVIGLSFATKQKLGQQRVPTDKDTQKIINFAKDNQKIKNDDVEKLLKVSDSTAQRYLQRLVEQGKLIQHGETGRSTYYTKT